MTTIAVRECPPSPNRNWAGLFEAHLDDRLLCTSRQPFVTAARVLVSEGHDPDSTLVMRHAGSNVDALSAKLGVAARLTVNEARSAFERWKAFSDGGDRVGRRGSLLPSPPVEYADQLTGDRRP